MDIGDMYWSWRKRPREISGSLFSYEFVRNSIDDAKTYCNDREGHEFLQGMVFGHMPISHSVGGNLQYFQALVEYAKQTQNEPETRLRILNDSAIKLSHAAACGLKFLMAQLVLAYGFNTKYPAGESFATNVMRHLGLMAEANALIEVFSKYSQPQKANENLFDRNAMLDLIKHNADVIEKTESKSRIDAEYIAICVVLDDLANREKGQDGHIMVMDILSKEYSTHQSDVMTYLAVNYAGVVLKPEYEQQFRQRLQRVNKGTGTV